MLRSGRQDAQPWATGRQHEGAEPPGYALDGGYQVSLCSWRSRHPLVALFKIVGHLDK